MQNFFSFGNYFFHTNYVSAVLKPFLIFSLHFIWFYSRIALLWINAIERENVAKWNLAIFSSFWPFTVWFVVEKHTVFVVFCWLHWSQWNAFIRYNRFNYTSVTNFNSSIHQSPLYYTNLIIWYEASERKARKSEQKKCNKE